MPPLAAAATAHRPSDGDATRERAAGGAPTTGAAATSATARSDERADESVVERAEHAHEQMSMGDRRGTEQHAAAGSAAAGSGAGDTDGAAEIARETHE